MEIEQTKAIIEAMLYSAGRVIDIKEFVMILELNEEDIIKVIQNMQSDFKRR